MNVAHYIRELGRGRSGARALARDEAGVLYGAILDGEVGPLEMGAIAIALRVKGETDGEMLGLLDAVRARLSAWMRPVGECRPLVIPSYNGARKSANLTPLLALLLARLGVPVLIHGEAEAHGRVTSEEILREFGIAPASSAQEAQQALVVRRLAYVPLALIAPGLSAQLALRSRLGLRNSAHSLVKMLDPFGGDGVLLASATHPDYLAAMRTILGEMRASALLLRATEGEPYANPKRRPLIEYLHEGKAETLFEAERDSLSALPDLPAGSEARLTAEWMRRVLAGAVPVPGPLLAQLACCLLASGAAADLQQALTTVADQLPVAGV